MGIDYLIAEASAEEKSTVFCNGAMIYKKMLDTLNGREDNKEDVTAATNEWSDGSKIQLKNNSLLQMENFLGCGWLKLEFLIFSFRRNRVIFWVR